jgi:hypothetical protein
MDYKTSWRSSLTDFGSYVDNLRSTPYRPWQTVAYAEGEGMQR